MLGDKKVIECAKLTSFFASKNLTKVIKNEIIGSYFFQQENYISSGPRSLICQYRDKEAPKLTESGFQFLVCVKVFISQLYLMYNAFS